MTNTVLPLIRLSIPFWTIASVRVSMLEVASSRISTGGLAMAAPGNGQKLPLSLGELLSVSAEHGVISLRKSLNKLIRVGQFRCRVNFLIGSVQFSVPDIFHDSAGKQVSILQYNAPEIFSDPPS